MICFSNTAKHQSCKKNFTIVTGLRLLKTSIWLCKITEPTPLISKLVTDEYSYVTQHHYDKYQFLKSTHYITKEPH